MNPRKCLEAVVELAQAAAVSWEAYESTCAAMALPTMRSAALDGRVSTSGHSDPTAGQVEAHQEYWETCALVTEMLGLCRAIVGRQTKARGKTTDISAEVKAARCDGVVGDDPTCTRNAVRDPTYKGAKHPTCWSCLSRRRRMDERGEEAS